MERATKIKIYMNKAIIHFNRPLEFHRHRPFHKGKIEITWWKYQVFPLFRRATLKFTGE